MEAHIQLLPKLDIFWLMKQLKNGEPTAAPEELQFPQAKAAVEEISDRAIRYFLFEQLIGLLYLQFIILRSVRFDRKKYKIARQNLLARCADLLFGDPLARPRWVT